MCVCVYVWFKSLRSVLSNSSSIPFTINYMDESGGHYAKLNKSERERKILYGVTYMWTLKKKKAKSIETENIMVVVRVWESEVEWCRSKGSVFSYEKNHSGDFPGGQWPRLSSSNTQDPGSICGQGTRSHMPQLRVPTWRQRSKTPHAVTKTH